MKRVLVLSILFLSLYAVTFAGFQLLGIDRLFDRVSIAIATATLEGLTDREIGSTLEDGTIWFQVRDYRQVAISPEVLKKFLEKRGGDQPTPGDEQGISKKVMKVSEMSIHEGNVNTNIPMFLAVVIALSGQRRWKMFAVLAVGTAFMCIIDGLSMASMIWEHPVHKMPKTVAYHALKLISVWVEGGLLYAPIFIGALVSFTWLKEEDTQRDDASSGESA